MTLIEADVMLKRQETPGEPDLYILESSATFENENFEPYGHGAIPTVQNNDGDLELELLITDSNGTNNSGSSTVEHLVVLGDLDFVTEPFGVAVEIKKGGAKKGKGHVRSENVVIISRPDS